MYRKDDKHVSQKMIFGHNYQKGAQKMLSGNLEFLQQELCNEQKKIQ